MKKKFLTGSLALLMLTTLSSFDKGGEDDASRRPMYGSQVTGHGDCYYTG